MVDHYGLDANWGGQLLKALADSTPKLLVIDDLADRPHQADVLLDPHFFGVETSLPRQCKALPPTFRPPLRLFGSEYSQLPYFSPNVHSRSACWLHVGVDQTI